MFTVNYSNEIVPHKGESIWKPQKPEYLLTIAFRLYARCHGVARARQTILLFSKKKTQSSKKDDNYKKNYNIV